MSFENISSKTLEAKKYKLEKEIENLEAQILKNKSYLYGLYLNTVIRKNKQRIREIEAELCLREKESLRDKECRDKEMKEFAQIWQETSSKRIDPSTLK